MNFKIGGEFIKIRKNSNNRFWNPVGMFNNISEININGEWFKCGISYIYKNKKSYIQISYPMKVDNTIIVVIKIHTEGLYKELETNNLQ